MIKKIYLDIRMSSIINCQFYCLSFNNEKKSCNMKERFENLNIDCKFYSGIKNNDERIKNIKNNNKKRHWAITYSHLDMIHDFYHFTDKTYAIICEDDILIHKNIISILSKVIKDFNILDLDILLLGYMLPYKLSINNIFNNYKLKRNMPLDAFFKYHDYPEYLSGTQMYMITKNHAKFLLDNYYDNCAGFRNKYFLADKIIIKDGNKALIYPMLAIENNEQEDNYHKICHDIHYNENYI